VDADVRLLWVGDLGYEVTSELLKSSFAQFGRVTRAWVVKESIPSQDSALAGNNENNKVVAKSLGYGFVEFQDVREAVFAQQVCSTQFLFLIGGTPRPVRVEFAETSAERLRRFMEEHPDPNDSSVENMDGYQTTDGQRPTFELVRTTELDPLARKYAEKKRKLLQTQLAEKELQCQHHLLEQQEQFAKHEESISDAVSKLRTVEGIQSALRKMGLAR